MSLNLDAIKNGASPDLTLREGDVVDVVIVEPETIRLGILSVLYDRG